MSMTKWGRRFSATMLVILMLVVAACSGGEKGARTEAGTQTPTTDAGSKSGDADKKPEEKSYTLEWLTYQYGPVDENAVNKKMLEDRFHVKFNIWYLDVTKREELLGTRLANKEFPDFMTVYSAADLRKFYEDGVTVGYTQEELETYMPNYKKLVDSYDPNIWKYVKYQGEYIGIPSINAEGVRSDAVAWRKDWLDNVGISKVPETLEEWEEAMYKFRNNDPDGNKKKDTYGMSVSSFKNIYGAFGLYPEFWFERDGKLVWGGVLPETKQALGVLAKWKKDDLINPEWVLKTGENQGDYWALSHDFINGKIGVSSHGMNYHWTPGDEKTGSAGGNNWIAVKEANPKAEIAYGAPPKGPQGKFGNITPGVVGLTYMSFGKNTGDDPDKKHRIMQIWDAIYGDFELWKQMKYGTFGEHSELAPDGVSIAWKEEYQGNNEKQAAIGANITFAPFDQPKFREQVTNPTALSIADQLYKHEGAGYENALKTSLPSDSKYYESLLQLQKETFAAIINGEKPLDEFDNFVKEWYQRGGETLTKEANEWMESLK
ncbi:hypothetical protein PAE9249_01704 [Paenibacillus sp. CECT 9249]|uniref:ABC transporter substrate-binding protein n=1 Tax=Paenibacillus sp. CECT 9249 TaxID=2845385 RepID=UPI001E64B51B|nr:ABC transporter substrate-binding protein [Paenibacillus sp. CECT 9249]CAH0119205.1 hypothetical protein PAE9249_01704 [Paenibacillus sp. CECT 9249]